MATLPLLRRVALLLALVSAAHAADDLSQQVLAEMNLARTAPARYAEYLKELRRNYQGKILRMPNSSVMIMTTEGGAAVDEAIRELAHKKPVKPLKWSAGLAEAANDLLREQGRSGAVGHDGARSGGMQERIERHGTWNGRIAENIGYGPRTARLMVMQLIIDDGVRDRGHRKNIFDPVVKLAGVACGAHPEYGTMCVTDFATEFSK
ncbi:CAP domain-containing protein [Geomonas sp. RF6]|uniref:CAP domain-containing protein n=1 Tax=Geomonas sp. RF6 TaxID=2897342 RepID=UPI001E44B3BD|nr:CAP domain-containing protein [Geomonas sp. RF6]UFS71990.1 CAP domain-containing protein [Geomonas sp. RF6]